MSSSIPSHSFNTLQDDANLPICVACGTQYPSARDRCMFSLSDDRSPLTQALSVKILDRLSRLQDKHGRVCLICCRVENTLYIQTSRTNGSALFTRSQRSGSTRRVS